MRVVARLVRIAHAPSSGPARRALRLVSFVHSHDSMHSASSPSVFVGRADACVQRGDLLAVDVFVQRIESDVDAP